MPVPTIAEIDSGSVARAHFIEKLGGDGNELCDAGSENCLFSQSLSAGCDMDE